MLMYGFETSRLSQINRSNLNSRPDYAPSLNDPTVYG
jgi:hypothetical protein